MEKKWSKIWKTFNKWYVAKGCPDWASQKRQLTQLIRTEFPKTNTRKAWAYYQREFDEKCIRYGCCSWAQQQNIIKKYVTVLHDDDEDPADLYILSMVFSGIGSHFHTTIKNHYGSELDFYETGAFGTYKSAMRFIRSSINKFKKEFNKKSVNVKFESNETQVWFYKDGD